MIGPEKVGPKGEFAWLENKEMYYFNDDSSFSVSEKYIIDFFGAAGVSEDPASSAPILEFLPFGMLLETSLDLKLLIGGIDEQEALDGAILKDLSDPSSSDLKD
ncbi:hypothetical protein ACLOJK_035585 [Asimina triloba]